MSEHFDLIVIGGGSGGIATSRKATTFKKKVALIERQTRIGGTCVNVGCIPKKIMWNTAFVAQTIEDAPKYGYYSAHCLNDVKLDFKKVLKKRKDYILKLNGIYNNNLKNSSIEVFHGVATFVNKNSVQVGDRILTSDHIVVSVGGRPIVPSIPGADLGITSDGFFDDLEDLPRSVCIVGAGYVAIELASVLNALGSEVTLVIRNGRFLRSFDSTVVQHLRQIMEEKGIKIIGDTTISKVERSANKTLHPYNLDNKVIGSYDVLVWAIGRVPLTKDIGLEKVGVKLSSKHSIMVDEYQNTSVPGIYAIGDAIGRVDLTPVAIAAGRRLARRLFNNERNLKVDYENIPTVIFSHPPVGTVGLSEEAALSMYGENNIQVYTSSFTPTYHVITERKEKTFIKVITAGPNDKIVGLHVVGGGADEMIQGFAVAVKMGATLHHFNQTLAIHPTSAEEVVLIEPRSSRL